MSKETFIEQFFKNLSHSTNESSSAEGKSEGSESSTGAASSRKSRNPQAVLSPKEVMERLRVQFYPTSKQNIYWVDFQGSRFLFQFAADTLTVSLDNILACTYEETVKAAMVANDINSDFSKWSCYLRDAPNGRSEKPVRVCLSHFFSLRGSAQSVVRFIRSVLVDAFTVSRDFCLRFEEFRMDEQSLTELLGKKDFINKLELAKRMMEAGDYDAVDQETPSDESLKPCSLVAQYVRSGLGEIVSLQVITDQTMEVIGEAEKAKEFDLRSYVRSHPSREEITSITLIMHFEMQDVIAHLTKLPSSSSRSLFFRLNVIASGTAIESIQSNQVVGGSCRTTVEIRLTSPREDYWEAKYMVGEVVGLHGNPKEAKLTPEQLLLVTALHPTVQDDLYWAMKFYNENCLFQSLFYMHRIFQQLNRLRSAYPEEVKQLPDIALYMGSIYLRLKMDDRAYYYLDKARENATLDSLEMYISCLCRLKDSNAIRIIKECLRSLADESLDKEENNPEYKFYLFLKRHLVRMYLYESRFSMAEEILNQMMRDGEESEFAMRNLLYIKEQMTECEASRLKSAVHHPKNQKPEDSVDGKE